MGPLDLGPLFKLAGVAIVVALLGGIALGYGCRGCGVPHVNVEWRKSNG